MRLTLVFALSLFLGLSSLAAAQNINSNLCEIRSKIGIQKILSPDPTKELSRYVVGLRRGSYSFNRAISGHAAADQLGFGKRFAAAYDQMAEEVEVRLERKGRVDIDEVIEYLSEVLTEEQFIDRLFAERDRHFPAIVYLRLLQEGQCAFPSVLRDAPTAQTILSQVALVYPELKKGFASEPFVTIYNRTVSYGRGQIEQGGSVSIYRLIEEWRREIVQSKRGINTNVAAAPPAAPRPPSISSGSGFFVTHEGHLLTNAHVVSNCSAISVKRTDDRDAAARVLATNEDDDLALLKIDQRVETIAILRIGRPMRTGESTVVFGFPLSGILASAGNATTGNVTALAGLRDDPHLIQISAPVQPGNSGGPVLDASGLLIGVVVSKLDALRVARAIEDVPQNVNFAIKLSTVANFLDAHGIAYKSAVGEKEFPIPDVVRCCSSR